MPDFIRIGYKLSKLDNFYKNIKAKIGKFGVSYFYEFTKLNHHDKSSGANYFLFE